MAAMLAYDALSMSGYSINPSSMQHEVAVLNGDLISPDMAQWLEQQLRALQHAGAPTPKRLTVQCVNDQTMGELHLPADLLPGQWRWLTNSDLLALGYKL